ncbi:N-acetylmuramoyl-L-alanine amidase [Mangrovibacterium diazotrophicum]|uniref:N-acetylmuramoyl-L-alanine amidase n=1 Tax=Mangrovibacterium diazotrophicum TaxID=1261403 RepID=A0A419W7Y6_9BACT|nr:N-acetylmuramoyl-L-alanine amidase [Mangrovibacterium diazotrophicum]RKD91555.1 N-acetylmuramoyl-L-alanine amidase [Mangrovibacterium diazotrophicum]
MSALSLVNHKLVGDTVSPMACPKNHDKFITGMPDTIIIHFTAGRDALSSAQYLCRDDIKASAHIVIGRQGEIYQLVDFDTVAWHAGESQYAGRSWYNRYSIGIELDNAGRMEKVGTEFQAWFGQKYQANDVLQAVHRNEKMPSWWHVYTPEQIEACRKVCELLIKSPAYNIGSILGHEEISPGRKTDPGPAFPLDKFRSMLLSQNRSDDQPLLDLDGIVVNADLLNIRESPSVEAKKVAQPLLTGAKLKVLEEKNGWYRVETKITGWVSKGFVKTDQK